MNATPNRRHVLVGIAALAAGPLARAQQPVPQPSMEEKPSTAAHASLTAIHYEIDFAASPQRFYQAILDQKQFAAFTGRHATIDPTPGGAFTQFGGLIEGRNIELVPNQRIVQAWRPTHWNPGIYSIVRFDLKTRAAETTLIF
jgi:activator of HSP90 ATPase